MLADLSQLPNEQIQLLVERFNTIKKAWEMKKIHIPTRVKKTKLSEEEEVKYVVKCLETPAE